MRKMSPLPGMPEKNIAGADTRAAIKVLLIDDDEMYAFFCREALKTYGIDADTCHTGWDAIKRFTEVQYCAVILDLLMPFWDGMKILKELKAIEPDVPVIMISGMFDLEAVKDAIRAGAADYVLKPPDFEKLAEVIMKACLCYQ